MMSPKSAPLTTRLTCFPDRRPGMARHGVDRRVRMRRRPRSKAEDAASPKQRHDRPAVCAYSRDVAAVSGAGKASVEDRKALARKSEASRGRTRRDLRSFVPPFLRVNLAGGNGPVGARQENPEKRRPGAPEFRANASSSLKLLRSRQPSSPRSQQLKRPRDKETKDREITVPSKGQREDRPAPGDRVMVWGGVRSGPRGGC